MGSDLETAGGKLESKVVDVRRLDGHHFEVLLRAEVQAWMEVLHWDYAASSELIHSYLEQKRLSGFALLEDGIVKGYCLYFREGSKGAIGDMFVEPGDSNVNRIALLLDHTMRKLIGMSGVHRIEAQLPHCNVDHASRFLHPHSFRVYLRQFMALPLNGEDGSAPAANWPVESSGQAESESGDFLFLPWTRRFDQEAAHLIHNVYHDHIDAALNDQYRSYAGVSRLLESITRYRGCGDYLEHASTAAVHRSTGKLAGVLATTAVRVRTAHIPQIAVANGYQGTGLGTAMLRLAIQKLRRDGFPEVSLTVTSLNARAVRLYERLGFRTFREFGAFVWDRA